MAASAFASGRAKAVVIGSSLIGLIGPIVLWVPEHSVASESFALTVFPLGFLTPGDGVAFDLLRLALNCALFGGIGAAAVATVARDRAEAVATAFALLLSVCCLIWFVSGFDVRFVRWRFALSVVAAYMAPFALAYWTRTRRRKPLR